jgi:hypothetical protein
MTAFYFFNPDITLQLHVSAKQFQERQINLTVIIQPFSIPSGPPIPIQKQK